MNKKFYAVANLLVIILVVVWNYYSNTAGINGNTVGELSREYNNLFTPASYAFSIWGLIFLALIALGIFMVKSAFDDNAEDGFINQIGVPLLIANIANGSWIWFWLNEYTGLSVLVMLTILISLLTIVVKLNMERWDAPQRIKRWVWMPISFYVGWISVATIANISAYLAKMGDWQEILSEPTWAAIMMVVAILVNLYMLKSRNMRNFTMIGAWALIAIAVRHWGTIPVLQWLGIAGVLLLLVANIFHRYFYLTIPSK